MLQCSKSRYVYMYNAPDDVFRLQCEIIPGNNNNHLPHVCPDKDIDKDRFLPVNCDSAPSS